MQTVHNHNSLDLAAFHRIDINLYPLFIAVYEQRSISKAAKLLSISQSAASHALQRLRLQLEDELFLRSGHKMLPTAYAAQIYPAIQLALAQIQAIAIPQKQFESHMLQSIRIALHDEVEPIVFPKIVQHFQALNPNIQFVSIKLDRKTVLADLATQQIDFFIDIEQDFSDKVDSQRLVQDQFVVCSQQSKMDADIYLASPHIGVSSRRTGILIEDIYLQPQQLSRQILLRCQHYSTALQILEQHPSAILTLPQHVLQHLQVSSRLNVFPAPVDFPVMNLSLYWINHLSENLRLQFLKGEIFNLFA